MASTKDFIGLTPTKLNINDIIETVIAPNCGAVSTFIGTTRDNFEQKKVVKLEYEAYEPMAVKEMQAVCNKIRSQWNVEKIAIYHRLGEVPVMEASIVIAVSSPHRQESLEAVQFAIDTVKTTVPIWKKEVYENDDSQWKENKECPWSKSIDKRKLDGIEEENDHIEVNNSTVTLNDINIDIENICETVEIKTEDNDSDTENFIVNPDEVQIKADSQELNRRINTFISRKREQINIINNPEFCTNSGQLEDGGDEATCARVNAVLITRKDCRSHVKVHRVYNQWSHQNIKPAVQIKSENETSNYPPALEERLSTREKTLGITKPVPRDVYERIKKIEDRLLFLESISPEYKDLWATDDCDSVNSFDDKLDHKSGRKRTYSSAELDTKLHDLEDRYAKRAR